MRSPRAHVVSVALAYPLTEIDVGAGLRIPMKTNKRPGGRANGQAKLYAHQVRRIRSVYIPRHPEFGGGALGRKYGVSNRYILEIIARRAWKHLL